MPTPGYVFKDGQPIPDDELEGRATATTPHDSHDFASGSHTAATPAKYSSTTGSTPAITPTSSTSNERSVGLSGTGQATDSHALAEADHEEKGAAQEMHFETEVKDLGWTERASELPKPLVGGLQNESLWLLVRRFDKQMYHVKALEHPPMSGLDLEIADEDEFSPDKLRANLERLYMTVIVGMMTFVKHIARLRSWREPRRTGIFFGVSPWSVQVQRQAANDDRSISLLGLSTF